MNDDERMIEELSNESVEFRRYVVQSLLADDDRIPAEAHAIAVDVFDAFWHAGPEPAWRNRQIAAWQATADAELLKTVAF